MEKYGAGGDMASAPPYNPQYPQMPPDMEFSPIQQSGQYRHEPPAHQTAPPPYYPNTGSGPPPPGPPGAAPRPQHTIIVAPAMRFGEAPVSMNCPRCHASIVTSTRFVSGGMAWLGCAICCFVGLFVGVTWLGCYLIPFCIDACKDVEHTCPNCKQMVGKMTRL